MSDPLAPGLAEATHPSGRGGARPGAGAPSRPHAATTERFKRLFAIASNAEFDAAFGHLSNMDIVQICVWRLLEQCEWKEAGNLAKSLLPYHHRPHGRRDRAPMTAALPPGPARRWRHLVPPLLVAVVTAAVFARLAWCGFTYWDDQDTIWGNARLNPPSLAAVHYYWTAIGRGTPGELYTPVTYTVWSALAAVAGRPPDADGIRLSPAVFHAANVLVHAAAAAAVCRLLLQLFGRPWPAVAGGLLFGLHPVQVEPVAWCSGTKDVLCGMFAAAALSAYVSAVRAGGRGGRRGWYLAASALFALAMLSKPTALVVPPMAFAIDVLLVGRSARAAAGRLWPWAVMMVPCAIWTRTAQPADWASPVALWQRPLVATDAVAFYLAKLAWPARLCVDYGRRPAAVVAGGAIYWTWVAPATVLAALAWRPSRPLAAAAALFALPLVPVSGLVPFDFQFYSTTADHYLYLPMIGVAVAACWGLVRLGDRTGRIAGGSAATAVVLVALAARTAVQMPVWQDTRALFTNVLRVNPLSFTAYGEMGFLAAHPAALIRGHRPTVPPTDPRYAQWRADLEAARQWYRKSLRLYPDYVPSLINLSINDHQLGDRAAERAALRQVVAVQPSLPPPLRVGDPLRLADMMLNADDPAAAAQLLDGVLRADPTDRPALLLRTRALARLRP